MAGYNQRFSASFCDVLRDDLGVYVGNLKKSENGGDLHAMVIALAEKSLLEVTLRETGGNQTAASRILGLNRNTLRRKIGDHKIDVTKLMGADNGGGR